MSNISDLRGIDISSWQAGLDISAAKENGIDFAILKISEGQTWNDPTFSDFHAAASVPIGAYVFSYATTPENAVKEAEQALAILAGRPLPLGLYMDIETKEQLGATPEQLTACAKAFCDTVRRAGYLPGIYGSELGAWALIWRESVGSDVMAWVANWSRKPSIPCDFWQTSDKGAFPGYSGAVDTDEAVSDRAKALVLGYTPAVLGYTTAQEEQEETGDFSLTIPALKFGDVGDAVKALQGELIAEGYRCGGKIVNGAERADGIFGNVTRESVATFQRKHNLVDTGTADKLTRAALLGVK